MSSDGVQKGAILMLALGEDEASEVLKHLGPREVQKLGAAMTAMKGISNEQLAEVLEDFMEKSGRASSLGLDSDEYIRSIRTAAEILNFLSGEIETSVMNNLRAYDEDMAQKIMDEMFVFENILEIDGRGIQMLLREVQSESLIVALKGASQELREKIF